jgi:FlaA1/EpsC-like NDP-sugar epimerase
MKYRSILITGGTGSFGKAFLKFILNKYKNFQRIVIFSRDEFKQFEMLNTDLVKKNKG